MRFMMLIKGDKYSEAGVLPDPAVLTAMGEYNEALVKAGVLRSAEGLHPTSKGCKVRSAGGKITVIDGPFSEAKEVIAGFWIIEVNSRAEAIDWASRIPLEAAGPAASEGTGQIEVRQISGDPHPPAEAPTPPPTDERRAPKLRYLLFGKANADTEAGAPPDPAILAAMCEEIAEMTDAGVLIAGEGLEPSSKGARVFYSQGKVRVTDGPFAETKELIAGFALIEVASKEEAIEWAVRSAKITGKAGGESECEIRQVFSEADFPAELVAQVPEVFEAEREFRARISQ